MSLNTPASEYPSEASHTGDNGSEASPPQAHAQHEYPAPPPQQEPSPRLQHQFAHMVSVENAPPVENLELTYSDLEPYDDSSSQSNNGAYSGSPGSVEHPSTNYQYSHGTTEYAPSTGSSTDGGMYHLDQMLPAHDAQIHPHYYEQQVA